VFLGIDLGTSSLKALVLDVDGTIVGTGSAPYPLLTPQPGWAEADPDAWWEAAAVAVREAAGVHASEIAAIGLSGQMHGVVLSDDVGHALRPAIIWADGRSRRQLATYNEVNPDLARPYSGSGSTNGSYTGGRNGRCSRRTGCACGSSTRPRPSRATPPPRCCTT
jgi:xylulokinase